MSARFRVQPGRKIRLAELDPAATAGYASKDDAREKLDAAVTKLAALQDVFAANREHALLVVLQGSDAAGKDGIIKHVMAGINPLDIDVTSFGTPTEEERAHDYLWRCSNALPRRGHVAVFNRSYYEEVGIVRVHRDLQAAEGMRKAGKRAWRERFEDINAFERHLTRNGTIVLKVFLNVSKAEETRRLLARVEHREKQWKIDAADLHEREFWNEYRAAYDDMLTHTNSEWAPWYVVPADHKWVSRLAVAEIVVTRLTKLKLAYPAITQERRVFLERARKTLDAET